MFLRAKRRFKDGKEHRYWSIVENQRTADNRVVQRQVLYLGEINDGQHASWCKTIDVFQGDKAQSRQVSRSGSMNWSFIGRGNGGRVGWPVIYGPFWVSTISGLLDCRTIAARLVG